MENNGLKVVTKTFENALFCCKNDLDNHEINNDGLISTITTRSANFGFYFGIMKII
jgi:hypothetical protein